MTTSSAESFFMAKGLPFSKSTAQKLREQGVLSSSDLRYLDEGVFLGLFAGEKPVTRNKAKAAWRELVQPPAVVQASAVGQPYNFSAAPAASSIAPMDIDMDIESRQKPAAGVTQTTTYSTVVPPGSVVMPMPAANPAVVQTAVQARGRTNSNATISLIVGIIGLCCGLGLCTGPVAIYLGYRARKEIAESERNGCRDAGECEATGGIVTGWISLIVCLVVIILIIVAAVTSATAVSNASDLDWDVNP